MDQPKTGLAEIFALLESGQTSTDNNVLTAVKEDIAKDQREKAKVLLLSAATTFRTHKAALAKYRKQVAVDEKKLIASMEAVKKIMQGVVDLDEDVIDNFADKIAEANKLSVDVGRPTDTGRVIMTAVGPVGFGSRPCVRTSCTHRAP